MAGLELKIKATDSGFTSTVNRVNDSMRSMDRNVKGVSGSVKASFASMAKAGAALAVGFGAVKIAASAITSGVKNFTDALDLGGRLADLSDQTGIAAGQLLLLERTFANTGLSAEKVGPTINKLQKFIMDAADGAAKNTFVLDKLGLSLSVLRDASPSEQLAITARAISGVESPAERAAAAMAIFGKAGGRLLPTLRGFSEEMENAKGELGSMVSIMDQKNKVFDTVSDKIKVIKGKFMELSAGILSQTIPAFELIATAISKIDAAGLGEKIAKAFVGGTEAMNGFSTALKALNTNEFSLSFQMAFASIKLQAKQTISELYRNFMSVVRASSEFLLSTLGPGSAIFIILKTNFSLIGDNMAKGIMAGIKPILAAIPVIGSGIADEIDHGIRRLEHGIAGSKNRINNLINDREIAGDFQRAAEAFPNAFKESYSKTKPLFDLKEDLENVKRLQDEINEKASGLSFNMADDIKKIPMFTWDMRNHLFDGERSTERMKANVNEMLTAAQQLAKEIKDAELKSKIDPGGRLEQRARAAMEAGKFDRAERIAGRLGKRETKSAQDEAIKAAFGGGNKQAKSLRDMAKEQGIDAFGKTRSELRAELADRAKQRQAEMAPGQGGKDKAQAGGNGQQNDPASTLLKVVQKIQTLVEKIEPKLPQHALGI